MTNKRTEFGKMLKQRRVMVPLTLKELGARSGVSQSHLGRIERAERFPSPRIVRTIARPLGLDESELLSMGGYPPARGSTEAERPHGLKSRVFELCNGKYSSLSELAQAMGITVSQIYRVRNGKRGINEEFIIGALKAFPEYKLDDLFYLAQGGIGVSSRRAEVIKLSKAGVNYAETGRRLGMSRERARQIVKGKPAQPKQESDLRSKAMLTIRDVARLLNVHINTIRRWSNKGILKSYRIGSRGDRRFQREDVDRFLKEGEIE